MFDGVYSSNPVNPILERQVVEPPMTYAAVVRHDVHYHFQSARMGVAHEIAVLPVRAEARVDIVVVGACVAVVRAVGVVVEKQRCRPYGGRAEVGDVVEMSIHTRDVAAVATEIFAARARLFRLGAGIVALVAVGETVGHEQVYHVGGRETASVARILAASGYFVGILEPLPVAREDQIVCPRLGARRNSHVHEQIVGAVGFMHARNFRIAARNGDIAFGDSLSVDHELERSLHTHPP